MVKSRILCIPDAHIRAGENLDRFKWLGCHIIDTKPDHVVIMGDFLTLESLSHFDKDKRKKMEGKRYIAEIATAKEALHNIVYPTFEYNKIQQRNRKAFYKPVRWYLMGNHEYRLDRYMEYNPTFDGLADLDKNLDLTQRNWRIIPYRDYLSIDGVDFTHIPMNKMKACEGEYVMHRVKNVTMNSTIFAHTHNFKVDSQSIRGQASQQLLMACGCFFEEAEDYMQGKQQDFWRGIVEVYTDGIGSFDFKTISTKRLEEMYG